MIYTGSEEIRNIMLGNEEISAIYCGEDLIYPMSVTAWSVSPSALEFELTGGTGNIRIASLSTWSITSSENWDWLTPSQISGGISGVSARTTVSITASVNNTGAQRSATLTITDDDNLTVVGTIGVTQYLCNPLVLSNNLGNTNNEGLTIGSKGYLFDSGLTEINDCSFDLTGIKSICARPDDGEYFEAIQPMACMGYTQYGVGFIAGCLNTVTDVNLSVSGVVSITYPFGLDDTDRTSQSITSVTLTDTENVYYLSNVFPYMSNLQSVKLGDLSNVTSATRVHNWNNTALTHYEVDALPDLNIDYDWGFHTLTALTVDSLVNILNALPVTTQNRTIIIGTTNINKLSAAQLAIATNKGWSVE